MFLAPNQTRGVTVPANQSIIISSYGAGTAVIMKSNAPNLLPLTFQEIGRITDSFATFGPYGSDMPMVIQSGECEVEYVTGVSPALTRKPFNPADVPLTGPLHFTNSTNTAGFDIGLLGGDGSATAYVMQRDASAPLVLGTNNTITMILTAAHRAGLGTSNPGGKIHVVGEAATNGRRSQMQIGYIDNGVAENLIDADIHRWRSPQAVDRMVLDDNGNLLVGLSTGAFRFMVQGTGIVALTVNQAADNDAWNAAAAAALVGRVTSSGRSINAAGTVNASGADYAEYMRKAPGCGDVAKGALVGIDAQGELTDKWSEAVSFAVKSTDPAYVGGDTWGTEEALGVARPALPEFLAPEYIGAEHPGAPPLPTGDAQADQLEIVAYLGRLAQHELNEQAHLGRVAASRQIFETETMPLYQQDLATFESALEIARQRVDRIAFAGQVPVNVTGAKSGDFIVPQPDGDAIKGIAVPEDVIPFEQYKRAVGKVIAIEPDGRARIIVKVV